MMFEQEALVLGLGALGLGGVNLLLGLFGLKLKTFNLAILAVVEVIVVAVLVFAVVALISGESATGSIFEFFGYVAVALIVPIVAGMLAIAEKSKNANIIIGIAGFTIAVMILRMWTIWSGQ